VRKRVPREDHRHDGRPAAAWQADETACPGDVVITPAVDRLSRDTTDLLVIARDMQGAGAGIRSLAEPFLDTTSDFAEIIFAILGVAAKLERRRILERTVRGRAD
jgi:DNA invertase Pin-like site-specific DNA recombinase